MTDDSSPDPEVEAYRRRLREDAKDHAVTLGARIRWYRQNSVNVLTEDEQAILFEAQKTLRRINERLGQ